jgi:hypothetical protein
MAVNRDFEEMLSALNLCGARFLIVGAHAVMHYAEPRFTKDIDIWVESTPENAEKVWAALKSFGAPLAGIAPKDLAAKDMVYQLGVEPNRIDIVTGITGVGFAAAWKNRRKTRYGKQPIFVLGLAELKRNKRAAGRKQDLLDLENLSKTRHHRLRAPRG